MPRDVLVVEETTVLMEQSDDTVLHEQVERVEIVAVAEQGPPGRPGDPGPAGGSFLQRVASETLSALVVVWEDEFGRVRALDSTDEDHIFLLLGIATTAASAGNYLNVQRSGAIEDDAWSWSAGQRIYLGVHGALTATPPNSGFDVLIGTALSPKRIALNLQDPIELE